MTWLIYGANGYTGQLIARLAVRRGQRPVLAGRSAARIEPLAAQLGLPHRVFGLDEPAAVRAGLDGVTAVAHCAGPFADTALAMALACLDVGAHYLDINAEIDVFESLHALDDRAKMAGIVILPGAAFDVVPTDCLAAIVAAALPNASRLDIAFLPGTGPSGGTARTALAGMRSGGRARIDGVIAEVPARWRTLRADFPSGPCTVSAVPWGDVSTAYYSTGIGDITTYTKLLPGALTVAPLLRYQPVRRLAEAVVRIGVTGPAEGRRSSGRSEVWARATEPGGRAASVTLTAPNPYDLSADSVVRAAERVRTVPPGAHTPSTAFGPKYVAELDQVDVGEVQFSR